MESGKQRSLANLRPPIQKGEIRNPLGISRKRPITERYWEVSERPMPDTAIRQGNRRCGFALFHPGMTWAEGMALRAVYEAVCRGLVRPMKEIREAIEGKAPQRLEIASGPQRKEVTLTVRFEKRNPPDPLYKDERRSELQ